MVSSDRFWLGWWISAFVFVLAFTALLDYACSDDPETAKMKIQAEQQLKMECIRNHGTWAYAIPDDSRTDMVCKHK